MKVTARKAKTIVGVYGRVRDHYYLAFSLVTPSPWTPRWEPHIIVDRDGKLKAYSEYGYARMVGYVTVVRYSCLREFSWELVKATPVKRMHLAPWGVPLLYLVDAQEPLVEERAALDENGAPLLLKIMKNKIKNIIIKEI